MDIPKLDIEHYEMKTEVQMDLLARILIQAKVPSFSFEEPFSHNITSLAKCLRQRYYSWNGVQPLTVADEPPPLYSAWGEAGDAIEQIIIDITKRAGIFRGTQIRVRQTNPRISGAIDIMVDIDGKLMPIEVKSSKAEAYFDKIDYRCPQCGGWLYERSKSCKCGYNGSPERNIKWLGAESKVSWEYYCQLQMYLYLCSNAANMDVITIFDEGLIWYYNKNTGDMTIHRVHYDQECIDWQLAKTRELEKYLESKTLPPRDFTPVITGFGIGTKSDWHCRFCNWRYNCNEEEILRKNQNFFKGGNENE